MTGFRKQIWALDRPQNERFMPNDTRSISFQLNHQLAVAMHKTGRINLRRFQDIDPQPPLLHFGNERDELHLCEIWNRDTRGAHHQARNDDASDVYFLVVSTPTTRGDRTDVD
jgi:hypothetical protein